MVNINAFIKSLKITWLWRVIKNSKNVSWYILSDKETLRCDVVTIWWHKILSRWYFFCGSFVLFMSVFVMLSCLFIAALWSPAEKGLTSLLLFEMLNCVFVAFPCGILGQVWYLIVLIPDLCRISFFSELQT